MRGRRGELRALFHSGLGALGFIHANRHWQSPGPTEITGRVLTMGLGMVPLAILLDWFAVKIAWDSEFLIIRVLFTIPGLVCTFLALVSVFAWAVVTVLILAHVYAYVSQWFKKRS